MSASDHDHAEGHRHEAAPVSRGAQTQTVPRAIEMTLNGEQVVVSQPPFRRLLDVLRDDLGLTGTKEGCGEGECGACSVLIDGMPVNSCLVPVCQVDGSTIVTVEGLAERDILHPVQQAFIDHGGAQCGICTPGMVVTAAWMIDNGVPPEQIHTVLAGNICRCTGYGAIITSVEAAIEAAQAERS